MKTTEPIECRLCGKQGTITFEVDDALAALNGASAEAFYAAELDRLRLQASLEHSCTRADEIKFDEKAKT